jgi:hypothetical protein
MLVTAAQFDTNDTEFTVPAGIVKPQFGELTAVNAPVPPPAGVGAPTHTDGPPVPQTVILSPFCTPISVTEMVPCPPVTLNNAA